MKTIILILLMGCFAFAQQLNYTWGYKQGGNAYDGSGQVYLDTTSTVSLDIYVDLANYHFSTDLFPVVMDSVTNLLSSDRSLIGTFFGFFDTQGTGAPTTDSVKYDIKVYPGVYANATRSFAGAKFGTAITLENVVQAGDYLSMKSVYVLDAVKMFPPELIKITIDPADTKVPAIDDSVAFYWRLVYPEAYEVHQEKIVEND